MVVGIVIGSGVFFKAQSILQSTGGNMLLGILAWVIGGIVMIICAFNFANFATKYVKVNGVVDYAEAIVGKKYAYMTGWFLSTIYFPAMTSVLAWVSARYTLVLFTGVDSPANFTGGLCMALGAFYLCAIYAINILSPKIAGKLEVSATVIKLIPLAVIVVIGTIAGLINGNTIEAFAGASADAAGEAVQNVDFMSVFSGVAAAHSLMKAGSSRPPSTQSSRIRRKIFPARSLSVRRSSWLSISFISSASPAALP